MKPSTPEIYAIFALTKDLPNTKLYFNKKALWVLGCMVNTWFCSAILIPRNFHLRSVIIIYLLSRAKTLTAVGTHERVFSMEGNSSSSSGNNEATTNYKLR